MNLRLQVDGQLNCVCCFAGVERIIPSVLFRNTVSEVAAILDRRRQFLEKEVVSGRRQFSQEWSAVDVEEETGGHLGFWR